MFNTIISNPIMSRNYNPKIHRRRSIRLRGYDYGKPGAFFITICTKNRDHLFGEIVDGKMFENALGLIVQEEWIQSAEIRTNIELGEFVVMPDHFHGIVTINSDPDGNGESSRAYSEFRSPGKNLGAMIRGFKGAATLKINQFRNTPAVPVWQRNYHERIIRSPQAQAAFAHYIRTNPSLWTNA